MKNKNDTSGTYVSIWFSNADELLECFRRLGFKNLVSSNSIHCTLLYAENQPWVRNIEPKLIGKRLDLVHPKLDMFGEDNTILVLTFDSPMLEEEHKRIVDTFGLKHSYKFRPHITLKEEEKVLNKEELDKIPIPTLLPALDIVDELSEVIDNDWRGW